MQRGKLFLFPSAIGESDPAWTVPRLAGEEMARIRHFIAENAKTARGFLKSAAPGINLPAVHIHVLDKHHPEIDFESLLKPALEGHDMGLLSEAGCPGIADPGAELVRAAHRLGIRAVPVTGPSSILLALMASGLNGQRFCFHGYLPVDRERRSAAIRKLEIDSKVRGQTQIFIETPYRNDKLLVALLSDCDEGTLLCLACGITSAEERIQTKSIRSWKKSKPTIGKIPCVFLIQAV